MSYLLSHKVKQKFSEDPDFDQAAEYLKQHHDKLLPTDLLDLYAFFKQGTSGDCTTAKPGIFQIQGRAKWNAWLALKGTASAEARRLYVAKLTEQFPAWRQSLTPGGVSVSRLAFDPVTDLPLGEKTLADLVRDNAPEFQTIISTLGAEINELDECGMGLIHWSTDRGHVQTLDLLVRHAHIDVNLRDADGQTALHYASSCGHQECIQLLMAHNADHTVCDTDGNSVEEVAFDQNTRQLIQSLTTSTS